MPVSWPSRSSLSCWSIQARKVVVSAIIAVIGRKRFLDRPIGENDQSVRIGIVFPVGIVQNDNSIYRVRDEIFRRDRPLYASSR